MTSAATASFAEAVVVDWSAAAVPRLGSDSCWVGRARLDGPARTEVWNLATRVETAALLDQLVDRALERGRRVLLAVDCSFGLAAGAVEILGLPGRPRWRALWAGLEARVHDGDDNRNDRFEVADALNAACGTRLFWGRPIAERFEHLVHLPIRDVDVPGLAANPLPRLRTTEQLAGAGVISNWMLVGKGAVGGQMLTCLPFLERLRRRLGHQIGVWPFDGPGDPGHPVVLAETWFGLFDWKRASGSVRDEQQVRGWLRAMRGLGESGIVELFDPPSLAGLLSQKHRQILDEEGWTLGVR